MTFGDMIETMRCRLTSRGTSPNPEDRIVKMGVFSNHGYMSEKYVQEAVDFLGKRAIIASSLGDKLNPLEKLGLQLLLESSYLYEDLDETA